MVVLQRDPQVMVFATLSGVKPIVVEQIYGPKVLFYYQLKSNKIMHSKNATLIHAWGPVMTISMQANVDMDSTRTAKRD
jgi:hypothetical protein